MKQVSKEPDAPDAGSANKSAEKDIKRFRTPLRIITVLILLAAMILWGVAMLSKPYDKTRTTYADFVVEEGADLDKVAKDLDKQGFIKSASNFKTLAKLSLGGEFKPGTYYLSPSMNSLTIIRTLHNGITTSKGFTVPAGYTLEQLATALDRDGLADKDKFLEAAASPDIATLDILGENPEGLKGADLIEGFLLPGEYTLSTDADEGMMVIMMLDAFANFYTDDFRARADELGVTTRQVLVMASMVEKETTIDKERAAIAGVIHNRINMGLTPTDELPEKPLCFPSKESITAILYPEESEYTYYVLSSSLDGYHKFTSDEAEYEQWLDEYNEAYEAFGKDEEADEGSEDSGDDSGEPADETAEGEG